MAYRPVIQLETHPRTAAHRTARADVKELSEKGQTALEKAQTLKDRGDTLYRMAVIGVFGDTCHNRAHTHIGKARTLLDERDNLCTEFGISLPEGAPKSPPKDAKLTSPAACLQPKPRFTVTGNLTRINTMRTQQDTLSADILAEAKTHYAKAARAHNKAKWAETFFLTGMAATLREDAAHYTQKGDNTAAATLLPEAKVLAVESSGR